jgi:hypothetical protein
MFYCIQGKLVINIWILRYILNLSRVFFLQVISTLTPTILDLVRLLLLLYCQKIMSPVVFGTDEKNNTSPFLPKD